MKTWCADVLVREVNIERLRASTNVMAVAGNGAGMMSVRLTLAATDELAAIRELVQFHATPVRVQENRVHWWQRELVGREYRLAFLRSLFYNCEGGMTPTQALTVVISSESNEAIRDELAPAIQTMEAGGSFADVVGQIKFFDRPTIAILTTGEHTGAMRQAIRSAIERNESGKRARNIVLGMMTVLSVDVAVTVSSALSMELWWIPWLAAQEIKDPGAAAQFQESIRWGYLATEASLIVALMLAAVVASAIYLALGPRDAPGRSRIERFVNRLPLLSTFFRHQDLADTTRIIGVMLDGGVALDQSIEVTQSGAATDATHDYWQRVRERLDRGDSVSRALSRAPLNQIEVQQLSAHRNIAQLAHIFMTISQARQEATEKVASVINNVLVASALGYGAFLMLLGMWLTGLQDSIVADAVQILRK